MVWFVLLHLVMFLVDLVTVTRRTDRDKDGRREKAPGSGGLRLDQGQHLALHPVAHPVVCGNPVRPVPGPDPCRSARHWHAGFLPRRPGARYEQFPPGAGPACWSSRHRGRGL